MSAHDMDVIRKNLDLAVGRQPVIGIPEQVRGSWEAAMKMTFTDMRQNQKIFGRLITFAFTIWTCRRSRWTAAPSSKRRKAFSILFSDGITGGCWRS